MFVLRICDIASTRPSQFLSHIQYVIFLSVSPIHFETIRLNPICAVEINFEGSMITTNPTFSKNLEYALCKLILETSERVTIPISVSTSPSLFKIWIFQKNGMFVIAEIPFSIHLLMSSSIECLPRTISTFL